jgi:hypothetical protein
MTEIESKLAMFGIPKEESNAVIRHNIISHNGLNGISLNGGIYDLYGNKILDNWLWGIMIQSQSSANIINSDIFENKCGGIRISILRWRKKDLHALSPPFVLSTYSLYDCVSLIFISTVYDSQTSLHTDLRPFFAMHPSNRTERYSAFIQTIYLLTIHGRSSNRTE